MPIRHPGAAGTSATAIVAPANVPNIKCIRPARRDGSRFTGHLGIPGTISASTPAGERSRTRTHSGEQAGGVR